MTYVRLFYNVLTVSPGAAAIFFTGCAVALNLAPRALAFVSTLFGRVPLRPGELYLASPMTSFIKRSVHSLARFAPGAFAVGGMAVSTGLALLDYQAWILGIHPIGLVGVGIIILMMAAKLMHLRQNGSLLRGDFYTDWLPRVVRLSVAGGGPRNITWEFELQRLYEEGRLDELRKQASLVVEKSYAAQYRESCRPID